ncbi:MAG TPA: Plug domain-containing protein, partial [Myxococcales bacterium]|nr:Plug domain-containing protein [Myxococcales bacterium]
MILLRTSIDPITRHRGCPRLYDRIFDFRSFISQERDAMLGTGKYIRRPRNRSRIARGLLLLVFLVSPVWPLAHAAPAAAEGSVSSPSPDEGLADMEEFAGAEAPISEQPLTELDLQGSADEDKYRGVEEILVTARGGRQNVQDISASIAAFDADYLEALGAENIADLSQFTPNLEIRTVFAASNPTLFIRGVGLRDFNSNSSSAVAVYNDDIYMNSPAGQLGQL